MSRILGIVFSLLLFVLFTLPANAQTTTYTVDYNFTFTPDNKEGLDVALSINLKNLRSDLYINEFSLTFPKNFITDTISAEDTAGPIDFVRSEIATGMRITFKFDEPTAKKTEHFITLKYSLSNLFSDQGFVKEAILPLIQADSSSKVNAELILPPTFNETLSISKPIPSLIEGTRISWTDVKVRTIYAVFGQSQAYRARLTYNLENSTIFPKTEHVVFPPDTLYQRMIIQKLNLPPEESFIDEDGNFIAEYSLEPKEKKKIELEAYIEVFTKPQDSMREPIIHAFENQKKFLLTEHSLWSLGSLVQDKRLDNVKDVRGIYDFVVDELSYSFDKIEKGNRRLGAKEVFQHPSLAVCTEFTDLFIALAREKGIYARELQGYGYSNKQNIRPLSLVSDVLHAWPEFYEPAQNVWIQIDPTWEDTSGIDYFSGLDVNHIVFVIHGKSATTPLPAGFYKTSASKDIDISISSKRITDKPRLSVTADFPNGVTTTDYTEGTLYIKNTGNSSFHNLNLNPSSKYINLESASIEVGFLAPYETKTIPVKLKAKTNSPRSDTFTIDYDGIKVFSYDISISETPASQGFFFIAIGSALAVIIASLVVIRSRH